MHVLRLQKDVNILYCKRIYLLQAPGTAFTDMV